MIARELVGVGRPLEVKWGGTMAPLLARLSGLVPDTPLGSLFEGRNGTPHFRENGFYLEEDFVFV